MTPARPLDDHTRSGRVPPWLPAALAAIPVLLLASMIASFGVDVPYWDQWDLVPDLEKQAEGRLGLRDLWAQHSEHRLLFPRAAMLALAAATGWDIRFELWLSLLLALVGGGSFLVLWRRLQAEAGLTGFPWLPVLAALSFFSLRQWENWVWGWQLQIHMNVAALLAGLALVQRAPGSRVAMAAAAGLGLVAQYSFATGLAYWPMVGFVIGARLETRGPERVRALALWVALSLASVASYFYGYRKPGWTPDVWLFLERPGSFLAYVLGYLGAPLTPDAASPAWLAWAAVAGLAALGLFVGCARVLGRAGVGLRALSPLAGLAGYALVAAAFGGVGRLGLGAEQALASRYVTVAQLVWLADLALLGLLVSAASGELRTPRRRFAAVALACIGCALTVASASGAPRFTHAYRALSSARAALRAHEDSAALAVLHPQRELLWQRARALERLRLSVYR